MVVRGELLPDTPAKDVLRASDRITERAAPVLIVIDRDFRVVLASQGLGHEIAGTDFVDTASKRLDPSIEKIVRDLVASWTDPAQRASNHVATVPPSHVVRVVPLDGDTRVFVAITIEQCRHRDSFSRAARAYSLSPRETEVLCLILEGASASEIANVLSLAESTVQGYFKHLLNKTRSRNRPAMVAKMLGWDGGLRRNGSIDAAGMANGQAARPFVVPIKRP